MSVLAYSLDAVDEPYINAVECGAQEVRVDDSLPFGARVGIASCHLVITSTVRLPDSHVR